MSEALTLSPGAATVAQQVVPRGIEFVYTFTLDGAGSISGATVTANIRRRGTPQVLIAALALSISDAANRIVTLTLSEANTLLLAGDSNDPAQVIPHLLDVTMVLSTVTTIFGPCLFGVRTPA